MKTKKTSSGKNVGREKEPMVQEASSRYRRQVARKSTTLRMGISLAAAKKRLRKPASRSKKDIHWALGIAGIGEGPEDLSANMRAYLWHEK